MYQYPGESTSPENTLPIRDQPQYAQPPHYAAPPYAAPQYYAPVAPMLQTPRGMLPLASGGMRLAAFMIDSVVSSAIIFAGLVIGFGIGTLIQGERYYDPTDGGYTYENGAGAGLIFFGCLFLSVIAAYAYRVLTTAGSGQTLGKRAVGIRVVTAAGTPPGFGTALLREVLGYIINGTVFYIGFASLLWDTRRQTWGDKIANTFVVRAE